mgnify:FL=1
MIQNLASRYKKTKIQEGIYVYRFVEVLQNVEYNGIENTIEYMKNNAKKTVYDMEDITFTITDEKNCFSDYLEIATLKDMYGDIEDSEILEHFKNDCTDFIRFGIFDEKNETLKIVSSKTSDLLKAKPDTNTFSFSLLSYVNDNDSQVMFSYEMLKQLIDYLETEQSDVVLRKLCEIRGAIENFTSGEISEQIEEETEYQEDTINTDITNNVIEDLDSLVGLKNIKYEVEKLKAYLSFINNSKDKLDLEVPNLNMVFYGNPGTGKTTVARAISKILFSLGYIKSNKFKEVTTGDFVAGYVGQTAIKTKDLINKNKDGVIFIDEAYSFSSNGQEFADEALVEILKEMENKETVFIFAGYTNEMKNFISMNPGIQSRVSTYLEFKDYSLEELTNIFINKVEKSKLKITDEALEKVKQIIEKTKHSDEKFGNARFIMQLFNKILLVHSLNVENTASDDIYTITESDINENLYRELNINSKQKTIGFKGGNL